MHCNYNDNDNEIGMNYRWRGLRGYISPIPPPPQKKKINNNGGGGGGEL